jgi:hypothetical protein
MRKRLASMLSALSPGCRESVRLLSEARDHPLSPARRMGLRIHLLLCAFCRRYQRQIEFLRTALHAESPPSNSCLPDTAKDRLKRRLEQATRQDRVSSGPDAPCCDRH